MKMLGASDGMEISFSGCIFSCVVSLFSLTIIGQMYPVVLSGIDGIILQAFVFFLVWFGLAFFQDHVSDNGDGEFEWVLDWRVSAVRSFFGLSVIFSLMGRQQVDYPMEAMSLIGFILVILAISEFAYRKFEYQ